MYLRLLFKKKNQNVLGNHVNKVIKRIHIQTKNLRFSRLENFMCTKWAGRAAWKLWGITTEATVHIGARGIAALSFMKWRRHRIETTTAAAQHFSLAGDFRLADVVFGAGADEIRYACWLYSFYCHRTALHLIITFATLGPGLSCTRIAYLWFCFWS